MAKSKKDRKKPKPKSKESPDDQPSDERFQAAWTRPQFSSSTKKQEKIKLDERFSAILTEDRFRILGEKKRGVVDKYGRRVGDRGVQEELSEFYTLEDDEAEDAKERIEEEEGSSKEEEEEGSTKEEELEKELDMNDPETRIAYLNALSRGEIEDSSSSDDDESSSSSSSSEEEEDDEHGFEQVGKSVLESRSNPSSEVELTAEPCRYLAVLNLDWSHIRAVDILVLLNSFCSAGDAVTHIRVLPSDYGMERMQKERQCGPSGIWKKEEEEEEERPITEQEDDYDPEKLRAYEASKLRYCFAIAEFTSSAELDAVYKQLDGFEFEHSSVAIDLQVISEENLPSITKGRKIRDEARLPLPNTYEPPLFIVDALQNTSMKCTWEDGDVGRDQVFMRYQSGGVEDDHEDLKVYLASSDESSDEEEEGGKSKKAQRMRAMLGLSTDEPSQQSNTDSSSSEEEEEQEGDKQITYIPETKHQLKEKIQSKLHEEEMTPWEKYQSKRKEKRKERRREARAKRSLVGEEEEKAMPSSKAELELLLAGDEEEEAQKDYNMREIQSSQKKHSKRKQPPTKPNEFELNVQDARFAPLFEGNDARFGIDTTDPSFKDTPSMKKVLEEQRKRRRKKFPKKEEKDPLKNLVKSVKRKVAANK